MVILWWGSEFAPPAPGHSSLETMTQPDYDNDLVFRSNGEEYARIDGNGEWKPRTPETKLEIRAKDATCELMAEKALDDLYENNADGMKRLADS